MPGPPRPRAASRLRRRPPAARPPPLEVLQTLEEVATSAYCVRQRAEGWLEELRGRLDGVQDRGGIRSRGVALADFGLEDVRRLELQVLPETTIREALSSWGPIKCMTVQTESHLFLSTVMVPGLQEGWRERTWSGEAFPIRAHAEVNAMTEALAAILADPLLGPMVDIGTSRDLKAFTIRAGQALDILARRENWVCCRSGRKSPPNWIPATHVVELAGVLSDHCVDGEAEALSARKGDVVEVVSRHYSGWYLCRQWQGIDDLSQERPQGWLCNTYLESCSGSGSLEVFALAAEALDGVAREASELEVLAARAGEEGREEEGLDLWMDECLNLVASLAEELERIGQAIADSESKNVKPGTFGLALRTVQGGGHSELSLKEGDKALVLHADASGWLWCRASHGDEDSEVVVEGWVPQGALRSVEVASPVSASAPSTALPTPSAAASSASTTPTAALSPRAACSEDDCTPRLAAQGRRGALPPPPQVRSPGRPTCAICLEPLGTCGQAGREVRLPALPRPGRRRRRGWRRGSSSGPRRPRVGVAREGRPAEGQPNEVCAASVGHKRRLGPEAQRFNSAGGLREHDDAGDFGTKIAV